IKIRALEHPKAEVREQAAGVLLWDEPVAAEEALIRATDDADVGVAIEAANTLRYYFSCRVVRNLAYLRFHAHEALRQQPEESFNEIRGEIQNSLCHRNSAIAARVRLWAAPVWELLDFAEDELIPEDDHPYTPTPKVFAPPLPVDELLAILANPDHPF